MQRERVTARITRSRGVRIPKLLLDQVALGPEVIVTAEQDRLVISRATRPRQAWSEQFRRMAERGDDRLLDAEVLRHLSGGIRTNGNGEAL